MSGPLEQDVLTCLRVLEKSLSNQVEARRRGIPEVEGALWNAILAQTIYSSLCLLEKYLIPELGATARDHMSGQILPFCMGEVSNVVCSLADGMSMILLRYPTEKNPTFLIVKPRGDAHVVNLNVMKRWMQLEAAFDQGT